jgi:hypothetical protein
VKSWTRLKRRRFWPDSEIRRPACRLRVTADRPDCGDAREPSLVVELELPAGRLTTAPVRRRLLPAASAALTVLAIVANRELLELQALRGQAGAEGLALPLDLRPDVGALDVQHRLDALTIDLQLDVDLAHVLRLQPQACFADSIAHLDAD